MLKTFFHYLTYAWCAGFVVIVALSIRKYHRRAKREKAIEKAYFKQFGDQNK